jgi:multicomponent Na+:H+ antiporter subunit F
MTINIDLSLDLNQIILFAMLLALSIPIYEAWKDENIWQTMLAFASISTKTAMIALVVSVIRDDWMIGVVSIIILSVGDAGIMLLAHILKRLRET